MTKKLYEVVITHTTFVMAEDERDAEREGARHLHEEEPDEVIAHSVSHPVQVPGHRRDSYPWGGDLDKTVGQLVAEMAAPKQGTERT